MLNNRKPWLFTLRNLIRTRSERLVLWLRGRPRQHFGPKARIPELFQRRDLPWLALQSGKLRMQEPRPTVFHDLLDAAARVGALEERLGYKFRNRMTCIEALKNTNSPLYWNGAIHHADKNNRLALLGDRVLDLVVCEIWFATEHSTKDHSDMSSATVSRVALAVRGRDLRLQESILISQEVLTNSDHIAETLEAVLGAVWIDSDRSLTVVKDVMKRLGLFEHEYLKTHEEHTEEERERIATRNAWRLRVRQEGSTSRFGNKPSSTVIMPRPHTITHQGAQEKESTGDKNLPEKQPPTTYSTPQSSNATPPRNTKLKPLSRRKREEFRMLEEKMRQGSGERARAAREAIRRFTMMRAAGHHESPAKIYQSIRQEMSSKAAADKLLRAEEPPQKVENIKGASSENNPVIAEREKKPAPAQDSVQQNPTQALAADSTAVALDAKTQQVSVSSSRETVSLRVKRVKQSQDATSSAGELEDLEKNILVSHESVWSSTGLEHSQEPSAAALEKLANDVTEEDVEPVEKTAPSPTSSPSDQAFFESEIELSGFMKVEASDAEALHTALPDAKLFPLTSKTSVNSAEPDLANKKVIGSSEKNDKRLQRNDGKTAFITRKKGMKNFEHEISEFGRKRKRYAEQVNGIAELLRLRKSLGEHQPKAVMTQANGSTITTPITPAEQNLGYDPNGKVKSAAPAVEAEQTPGKSKAADDSRVDPDEHTRTSYWIWRKPRDEVQIDSTPTIQTDSQADKGDKGKPLHHLMLPEAEAMSVSEEPSASPADPASTSVEELPLASVLEQSPTSGQETSPSVSLSEPSSASTPTKPEGLALDQSATSEQEMSTAIASESPSALLPEPASPSTPEQSVASKQEPSLAMQPEPSPVAVAESSTERSAVSTSEQSAESVTDLSPSLDQPAVSVSETTSAPTLEPAPEPASETTSDSTPNSKRESILYVELSSETAHAPEGMKEAPAKKHEGRA